MFAAARARYVRSASFGTECSSTMTTSAVNDAACCCNMCRYRSAVNPAVSPGSASRLTTTIFMPVQRSSTSVTPGTRRWGTTEVNQEPGPRVMRSAFWSAVMASSQATAFSGTRRTRRTDPTVVATATWPRTCRTMRGSASRPPTSASISRGCSQTGRTRPSARMSFATTSRAATSDWSMS